MTGSEASLSSDRGTRLIGVIGILAGVFTIIYVVAFLLEPVPATPDQQLTVFNSNQTLYAFTGAAAALFAAFIIAFAAGFAGILRQKSPSVAYAAAFLVAAGVLAEAIAANLSAGSLFAISAAPSTAAYATDATYFAAVVFGFAGTVFSLDPLLSGIGLLLFAWVTWKGEVFPSWHSYVLLVGGVLGIVAGLAGILAPTSDIPIDLADGFAVLAVVWLLAAGTVLLRSKPTTAQPAK